MKDVNRSRRQRPRVLTGMVFWCILAASQAVVGPNDKTLSRLSAAAKAYFRDTAELPMKIAVNTTVTDPSGKTKKQSQGSVDFVFQGYSPRSGKASFTVVGGMFHRKIVKESFAGNYAMLDAGLLLRNVQSAAIPLEIEQAAGQGQPLFARLNSPHCAPFKLKEGWLFPETYCGRWEYRVIDGAKDLKFEHLSFDSSGLPTAAKIAYLGDVNVLGFHFDEDFQEILLAGEPIPFLLPKRVVTTITTSKGKITVTNQYTPKNDRGMPPS